MSLTISSENPTGSYFYSLIYVGFMPLLGAALYIFALGEVKRLEVATKGV